MIKYKIKDFPELRHRSEDKLNSIEKKSDIGKELEVMNDTTLHIVKLQRENEELLAIQSKLVKSIEEYSEILGNAPIGFFILDCDGVILNVNQTGLELLGLSVNKLIGKSFSNYIKTKSNKDDFLQHRQKVIEEGGKHQIESEIRKADGSVFSALIESNLVKDEHNYFKHFLTTVSDISLEKEHERQIEKAFIKEHELNELKSRFLSIALHEFRTPLAAILLSSELLEKYGNTDDKKKRTEHSFKIKTAVNRLKEILSDFLSATEVEQGKIKNIPDEFNLIEFMESTLSEMKSINGTHQIVYSHVGKYKNVFLDRKLLKLCISSLMINAYKYSPNGGEIEVVSEQSKPGEVKISIKDYGIGIPEPEQAHIFEFFYRANNTVFVEGTGIGLNVTKKILAIMGGKISFISEEYKGSTFFLDFPGKKK